MSKKEKRVTGGLKVGDVVAHRTQAEKPTELVEITKIYKNGGAEFKVVFNKENPDMIGARSRYGLENIKATGKIFEEQFVKPREGRCLYV